MNKETFLDLVPVFSKNAKPNTNDWIYKIRLPLDSYEYNYSHCIIEYMKACGCKIHRTNWNFFGGFYIYYSEPQKYVDPVEFIETYKEGVHIDTSTSIAMIICFMIIIILIAIGVALTTCN